MPERCGSPAHSSSQKEAGWFSDSIAPLYMAAPSITAVRLLCSDWEL